MTLQRVGPRVFICRETVVDVPPMVGRGVGGFDAQRVNGVDSLEHALDLGPAVDEQRNLAAGGDARPRPIGSRWTDRTQDVDAPHPRAAGRVRHIVSAWWYERGTRKTESSVGGGCH